MMLNRCWERGLKKLTDKKYAFFIDIDGTLINKSGVPSKAVKEKLEYARSLGCKVFINTGRARGLITDKHLKSTFFDGIIAANGQYIELDGKVLRNVCLEKKRVEKIVRWANGKVRSGYAEGVYKIYNINYDDERFGKIEDSNFENISKMLFFGELSEKDEKLINDGIRFYRHKTYFETVVKGYSKASAMKDVLKEIGFPSKLSVAIGDSENDMEMICEAGIGIAMGNAVESLKKAADYIVASNENDGVAEAVNLLVNFQSKV